MCVSPGFLWGTVRWEACRCVFLAIALSVPAFSVKAEENLGPAVPVPQADGLLKVELVIPGENAEVVPEREIVPTPEKPRVGSGDGADGVDPAAVVPAADDSPGLPPLPDGVVTRLADDSFQIREAAEKELVEWAMRDPEASIEPLYEMAMGHEDPEVRARALSALKAPLATRYLAQGRGYVGITMNQIPAELPGGGAGVVITQVVAESPAAGAGLQAGDVVTAINGTGWEGGDAVDAFRTRIQGMKPGTRVTLGILREGENFDAGLELGRLPPGAELPGFGLFGRFGGMPMMEELDFKAMEEAGKEEHFRQWLRERRAAR